MTGTPYCPETPARDHPSIVNRLRQTTALDCTERYIEVVSLCEQAAVAIDYLRDQLAKRNAYDLEVKDNLIDSGRRMRERRIEHNAFLRDLLVELEEKVLYIEDFPPHLILRLREVLA